jgi:hypothetical protein
MFILLIASVRVERIEPLGFFNERLEIFIKNGQLSFSDIIHNYGYSILWHSDNLGNGWQLHGDE